MKIYVRNNDISKALRILKKKLHIEGDMKKLREKEHFTSVGEKKRLEEKAGRKRWLKKRAMIEKRAQKNEQQYLKNRKRTNYSNENKKPVAKR
jgi:ribosomal protein S21